MKYAIRNTYHNTATSTKYNEQERADADLAPAGSPIYQAMRRAHDRLCGSADCTCSNSWGERYK